MQQFFTINQLQTRLLQLLQHGSALERAFAAEVQASWQQLPLQELSDIPRWNLYVPRLHPMDICLSNRRVHLMPLQLIAVWQRMQQQAEAQGVHMYILSAYRSIVRQHGIVMRKLAAGMPIGQILAVNALPGCSEHHSGLALDIGTQAQSDLEENFAASEAFAWLQANAAGFGFVMSFPENNPQGYIYEPWHWYWQQNSH